MTCIASQWEGDKVHAVRIVFDYDICRWSLSDAACIVCGSHALRFLMSFPLDAGWSQPQFLDAIAGVLPLGRGTREAGETLVRGTGG